MFGPTEFAITAMCFFGICDFIYKRSARAGFKPLHFITGQTLVFWLLILTYAWLSHRLVLTPAVMWNGVAGLFMFIAFFHFFKSLETGSVSINAPIFRLSFMITAALAILFLHESLSFSKLAAAAFAFAAIWLLLGSGTVKISTKVLERRSLVNVTIATVALGATNFFHKLGVSAGALPETGILASATVFCSFAILIAVLNDRNLPLDVWKLSAPAGVALACALLFLLHALTSGPASVLVPISQMGFIVPAVLGVACLGETLTFRKVGGLTAAVIALGLFAIS